MTRTCTHLPLVAFGAWLTAVALATAGAAAASPAPAPPPAPAAAVSAPAPGRVAGVVKDQSGAVVHGATVEARAAGAGEATLTTTDREGRFVFDALPAGRYRITAVLTGFEPAVRDRVDVAAGGETAADLMLTIARQASSVVVSASPTESPLSVETDPRAPRQPIPAHDGADYLKTIPGFAVVRKGGTDGDPVLRGMAGSRLGILLDGQQILGGCGGRMDPPTAYVYPASYDRITVLKGPQSVLYAAGASAGVVLFERSLSQARRPAVTLSSAFTAGSFGRDDEFADARVTLPAFYLQAGGTRSHTDDYRDGGGAAVHSFYTRWSGNAAAGWTPTADTRLEVSLAKSNGRAAYADRMMDGTRFARDNVALRFDRRFSSSRLQRIEFLTYYNYIDHVMDNFSLRTPGKMFSAANPDRKTTGGRAAMTFAIGRSTSAIAGADLQHNVHTMRRSSSVVSAADAIAIYAAAPRSEDMRFTQVGVFGEVTRALTARDRLVGGLRADWHRALDSRACIGGAASCPAGSPLRNDTQGLTDRRTLGSGFARYEHDLAAGESTGRFTVGVGHAERAPDYWERVKQDPTTLGSDFLSVRPEKTTQLDTGVVWSADRWSASVSGYYGRITDYVLIRWMPTPAVARNVDATTAGGEASFACTVVRHLKADVSLAYVRSENTTDGKPLAQQPPAEGRVGLAYDDHRFSVGGFARLVAAQDRVDVGSGNIVSNGMDLGPTPGFTVFSLNGGYRLRNLLLVTAGVDNLFNRTYAEHISQAGSMVPGFVQTTRVNEPGRTIWMKVNVLVR